MILVFGATGQVAKELASFDDVKTFGRNEADLSDPHACARLIENTDCVSVITAAAYTAVDRAEEEEATASVINGEAPAAMAMAARAKGVPFVHISTDYVFDGTGTRRWKTNDETHPINAYGRSKLLGEEGIAAVGGVYAIMRTSWVVSAHGHNFVKTMLRLGKERDALNIVDDQIGGPTPARDIARAAHQMALDLRQNPDKTGIYHFSGAPDASWADFAREIFSQADLDCKVTGILTKDYPTPAARPLNSRLDCSKTAEVFGIEQPDWREGLKEILEDLS